ncbi:MAG: WecB/TagA/CpsF family glycosyltransferase [Deltaproteobacteria bacterium]|nr:WecB/TagA/CpsF family glycosyltransferase [Deltaproteobacteria bacterium]
MRLRKAKATIRPGAPAPTDAATAPRIQVLGVQVAAVQIEDVVAQIEDWIAARERARYVAVANVHMVVEASNDPVFRAVLDGADLVVPDGMPLVWLGRLQGHQLRRRVYGPELMLEFLRRTQGRGYRHFFYGDTSDVVARMLEKLRASTSVEVAGHCSPPFRPLTPEEDRAAVAMINRSRPDVLWVALGCPKQEQWMHDHRDLVDVPVMVGVGQAFPIIAGELRQAPALLREHGLEWLFRLVHEPGRLWRRYLVGNSEFVMRVLLDEIVGRSSRGR